MKTLVEAFMHVSARVFFLNLVGGYMQGASWKTTTIVQSPENMLEEEIGRRVRCETNAKQTDSLRRVCHRTVSPVIA